MNNIEVRTAIKEAGLKYWEVAEKLGMNDGNFSRKLRKELSDVEKQKVIAAIQELKAVIV